MESPFAAPVVVAPKKDEGGQWAYLRYVIDYMRWNVVTVRDQYPTSVPEKILAKMDGATLFILFNSASFGVPLGQPFDDLEENAFWREELGCLLAASGG